MAFLQSTIRQNNSHFTGHGHFVYNFGMPIWQHSNSTCNQGFGHLSEIDLLRVVYVLCNEQ